MKKEQKPRHLQGISDMIQGEPPSVSVGLHRCFIQPHDLLKIRNITPTTNLPHPGNSRLNGNPCSVMQLILLQLIRQNRSGT